MLLKGASALYKAPLKFEQIYVCTGCLRRTAKQHVCAQKQISSVTTAPSWSDTILPLGLGMASRCPLNWSKQQHKLYLLRSELKFPITCWTLCRSLPSAEMPLSVRKFRNTVDLFKRVNLLKLFGNKTWSSAYLQNILSGHCMVVVKNSYEISWTCQGMLQFLLGGLWSEAPAHDLLGSVQQIYVLGLWF